MAKKATTPAKKTAKETAPKTTGANSKTAKKAIAKKTAPKEATKSDLPVQSKAPTTKPTAKVKEVKIPFQCPENEKATVKMPNGQTVKVGQMRMLLGALRLESNIHNRVGIDAVKVAKGLLNIDGNAESLWLELKMFLHKAEVKY